MCACVCVRDTESEGREWEEGGEQGGRVREGVARIGGRMVGDKSGQGRATEKLIERDVQDKKDEKEGARSCSF